ncbi:unnamed protein product [Ranitomeya imitator]|uniref:Transposase Tc1-like domain-containing protein n=1 Tax=Ranitomeya imitator TaxID=111125 RepID=A0ABN9LL86_9NEOB|nr:unnamed protein product [Ranitomeya imitator]
MEKRKKTKELSEDLRNQIVRKHEQSQGYKSVSKDLNVPVSTVRSVIKKCKAHGTVANLPRCGRKRKMDKTFQRKIVRMLDKEPRLTSKQVQAALQSEGTTVSTRTIRRHLNEKGLYGRRPRKTPLLTPRHKKARLEFAKTYLKKPKTFWKNVLWSCAHTNPGIGSCRGLQGAFGKNEEVRYMEGELERYKQQYAELQAFTRTLICAVRSTTTGKNNRAELTILLVQSLCTYITLDATHDARKNAAKRTQKRCVLRRVRHFLPKNRTQEKCNLLRFLGPTLAAKKTHASHNATNKNACILVTEPPLELEEMDYSHTSPDLDDTSYSISSMSEKNNPDSV